MRLFDFTSDVPLSMDSETSNEEAHVQDYKKLESYVQYVYSTLLNLKDEGVVVSSNAILVGNSGAPHEIDVFYQFEKSGITHKVAFECKYTKARVEKADVMVFHKKLEEIGNIVGIMVSRSDYQSGAKTYAAHYGISLTKIQDLPALNILMSRRLESVALPNADYIGEPFWTLMEIDEQGMSGNFHAQRERHFGRRDILFLFISRRMAEEYLSQQPNSKNLVVRGLPQHSLKFILGMAKMDKQGPLFYLIFTDQDEQGNWPGNIVDSEYVESRFLLSKI